MQTKLTLRLDDKLIQTAKATARQTGKSVSQMVADYFRLLDAPDPGNGVLQEFTPTVRALLGCLKGTEVTEEDYYRYLEEKYR